jgi:hypothetical protein
MGQTKDSERMVIMTQFNSSIHRAEKAAHFIYGIYMKKQSPMTAAIMSFGLKKELENTGRFPVRFIPDEMDEPETIIWNDFTTEKVKNFLDYATPRFTATVDEWERIQSAEEVMA